MSRSSEVTFEDFQRTTQSFLNPEPSEIKSIKPTAKPIRITSKCSSHDFNASIKNYFSQLYQNPLASNLPKIPSKSLQDILVSSSPPFSSPKKKLNQNIAFTIHNTTEFIPFQISIPSPCHPKFVSLTPLEKEIFSQYYSENRENLIKTITIINEISFVDEIFSFFLSGTNPIDPSLLSKQSSILKSQEKIESTEEFSQFLTFREYFPTLPSKFDFNEAWISYSDYHSNNFRTG